MRGIKKILREKRKGKILIDNKSKSLAFGVQLPRSNISIVLCVFQFGECC